MPDLPAHKILWLASYPKSGNTWFRAFLTALMNDCAVDINHLVSDRIFSSRRTFDAIADIDSRNLYDSEAKLMIADVYRYLANAKEPASIIKIHDAFVTDSIGKNIVPENVTHCAVYFIRNPLDIAGSLASHVQLSIEEAVDLLNNSDACLPVRPENLHKSSQLRQYLSDWSSHVNSWTLKPTFPVCVVRYEDMLANPFETFTRALNFIGWHYTPQQILNAIKATSFDRLSKQETEKGFREKSGTSAQFFRKGTAGNWKEELSEELVDKIKLMHKIKLEEYGY